MNAIWQMYADALTDQLIDQIITECEYYAPQEALVGNGMTEKGQSNHEIRRSEVRFLNPADVNSRFVFDLVTNFAQRANRDVFNVDMNYLQDLQYTKYYGENQGFYSEHFDTFWANPSAYDRKLSVTVQLSDSDEYEGGDFLFHGPYDQPDPQVLRRKGTVLVFPSPIMHKVTPVTKGVRKTLVAWMEGPKWR